MGDRAELYRLSTFVGLASKKKEAMDDPEMATRASVVVEEAIHWFAKELRELDWARTSTKYSERLAPHEWSSAEFEADVLEAYRFILGSMKSLTLKGWQPTAKIQDSIRGVEETLRWLAPVGASLPTVDDGAK